MTSYAETAQRVEDWEALLEAEPDIMLGLIRDVLKVVQSQAGEQVGRRRAADALDYDELWHQLAPERYSIKPLPEALADLIAPLTQGQFALKVPCSRQALGWLVRGQRNASPDMMEALARAGGVTPAYFREWRAWRLFSLVINALVNDPERSAAIAKGLSRRTW